MAEETQAPPPPETGGPLQEPRRNVLRADAKIADDPTGSQGCPKRITIENKPRIYKNEETAPPTTAAATEEPAAAPTGDEATTEYYGGAKSPTTPAWAAKATMNPDYKTEETLAPEAAAAAEDPAPPPTGEEATTEYYGGTKSPTNPAWAAEATMNPDYKNEEIAPPTTAAATEGRARQPTGEVSHDGILRRR